MSRLKMIDVAPGIVWVEAPEADLRIQCGCPADSVKHLMRQSLVAPAEIDGVNYEAGPNAVLLSDVPLQGGGFANLAEFPILQMLYRQGMIIPGHPCNTGQRPLLLGGREQLHSQLEYIHRGNYGLVSEEEIMATGIPADQAREMMAIKLKFAFGKIAEPTDLLETLEIGHSATEIRGGVTILRMKRNHFRFMLGDECVEIDLNLSLGERYASPYAMEFHDVERDAFAVLHSGEGDGWDINRPSMSSVLMHHGRLYLIDAGPNLETILNSLGIGINEIEGVFQTHAHDDHFAGLTTLMQADHRIKFLAAPLVRASVTRKLSALLRIDEDDFVHYFDPIDLIMDEWNDVAGLEASPTYSPHPVETTIFKFRAEGPNGYRTYAHLADIASFQVLDDMAASPIPGLPEDLTARTRESYLEPANLKKLDIGGGLIHGMAADFDNDHSDKIVLAHIARQLTLDEEEIGSGATFGTVDVLIPGKEAFLQRFMDTFLSTNFPDVPHEELLTLIDNPVETIPPGATLIERGTVNEDIYLVLAGNVKMDDSETGTTNVLSAGAFIGETSGLHRLPSAETFRAASYVRALRLKANQYIDFVNTNGLFEEIVQLEEMREFLLRTRLFGEALSYPTLNMVAKSMTPLDLGKRPNLAELAEDFLYLVETGMLIRLNDNAEAELLNVGDFFGEESALMGEPRQFTLHAKEDVQVYAVPSASFMDIPVVRWKLFESWNKRLQERVGNA
ncbi:MAG: cyclic nucleotide-binding domain-containing protein [Rhodospirillaceae bacterium]|nr:cyclic nucleotide-binding domain-containing protein [Rhodospirillaceae bacterium]